MTPKQKLYLSLTERLGPLWQKDALFLVDDRETWEQVRIIDEWLLEHMENPKVGEEQFERVCTKLLALYQPPATRAA